MTNVTDFHGDQAAARNAAQANEPTAAPQIDLPGLQAAINQASSSAASLWLSFLTFMAYLTMTVGAVTHEILLKQKPIVLPVLNVNLPLVGFFWIAPLFFLLFHFYLFLQLSILVRKVASFDRTLRETVATEPAREDYRKRLDPFLIVQFLGGAREERIGMTGRLLRLIAVITLVILPIALLMQFQLTFLPYHEPRVTWVQRIAVLVDLRLVWVFWFAIRRGRSEINFPEFDFLSRRATANGKFRDVIERISAAFRTACRQRFGGILAGALVIFFSFFVFAFRDEPIGRVIQVPVPHIDNDAFSFEMQPISDALLHGPIDMVEGRPKSWFSNVLVVPNKKLIDDNAENSDFPSFSLRGRNLSGAVLIGSDLRNVDFTGANLNEAHLERALLTRAKFRCGSTFDVRTKTSGWPEDECTWLQLASLAEAQLQAADFERARMQGAILIGANLTGAQLAGTQLQGAMLINAQLQASSIEGASLNHAFLNGAYLIGAKISNSDLSDMLIGGTIFQLTYIEHDRSKLRLVSGHPAPSADGSEPTGAGNDSLSAQFMHAEFQNRDVTPVESISAVIDPARLTKLRQVAIAQLAAQNKMQNTDFDKVYNQAEELDWDVIDSRRKKLVPDQPSIKQYAIDFACDAGSSPYIMDGLIRDEKIMWVLDKISSPDSRGALPKESAVQQAVEVLAEFSSPKCAGAAGLSKNDTVAIGLMKQKVAAIGKTGGQSKKSDGDPVSGGGGSGTAGPPKVSTPRAGGVH
jgi:uncharacterized protein YjbI with pentapeptide repeats